MKLLDALENIDIRGCTIGECHKIKSHDIEFYNEKYVVNKLPTFAAKKISINR